MKKDIGDIWFYQKEYDKYKFDGAVNYYTPCFHYFINLPNDCLLEFDGYAAYQTNDTIEIKTIDNITIHKINK